MGNKYIRFIPAVIRDFLCQYGIDAQSQLFNHKEAIVND